MVGRNWADEIKDGRETSNCALFIFSLLLFWLHEYFTFLPLPLLLLVVVVIVVTSSKYLLSEAFFILPLHRSLL